MGSIKGVDDNIYGVPLIHEPWLKIDTATETTFLVGDDLFKYGDWKYNSGVVCEDSNIYSVPEDSEK